MQCCWGIFFFVFFHYYRLVDDIRGTILFPRWCLLMTDKGQRSRSYTHTHEDHVTKHEKMKIGDTEYYFHTTEIMEARLWWVNANHLFLFFRFFFQLPLSLCCAAVLCSCLFRNYLVHVLCCPFLSSDMSVHYYNKLIACTNISGWFSIAEQSTIYQIGGDGEKRER